MAIADTIAALRASAEAAAAEHAARPRDRGARERAQERKIAAWRQHYEGAVYMSRAALCPNVREVSRWIAAACEWRILAWCALADGDWHLALHYRRRAIEETAGVPLRVEVMR